MNKKFLIVAGILLIGLISGIWQYIETFQTESVSAVIVGVPNPGHTWSSMECNADSLCLDTANNRLGIGTNTPATALDVKGTITASTDVCLGNGTCLSNLVINGVCGTANQTYSYNKVSYGSDTLCAIGASTPATPTFPSVLGTTSWNCNGLNGGVTVNCSASRGSCPSGTTCSTVGSDVVLQWKTVGSYYWTVPTGVTSVEYLIVAGGGSGASDHRSGGGGAGEVKVGTKAVSGNIAITVGTGGAAPSYSGGAAGNDGSNSTFSDVVAYGGGGGGSYYGVTNGRSGGCGGGAGEGGSGGSSTANSYGNAGGSNLGGGGGAGAAGNSGNNDYGGTGGVGYVSSITGTATYYGGGGGGGTNNHLSYGGIAGGTGGGGAGNIGGSGAANTGGGGGAGGPGAINGGVGGSGIVIVRFTP